MFDTCIHSVRNSESNSRVLESNCGVQHAVQHENQSGYHSENQSEVQSENKCDVAKKETEHMSGWRTSSAN